LDFICFYEIYFDFSRFEVISVQKVDHWIWYIFPQLRGIGESELSYQYGIEDLEEAREFLNHEVLGSRLNEIVQELLKLETNNAVEVFGRTDSMKLRSCMTLFSIVENEEKNIFEKALEKYFQGNRDEATIVLLNK